MKQYSLEFKVLFVFMILQQICLWTVQFLHSYEGRYLIQETFLASCALGLLIITLLRFSKTKKVSKPTFVQWVLVILIVIAIAATINAIDVEASLTGRDKRYEGLYSLLGYYFLCWYATLIRDEPERRILLREFAVIGCISAVVGIAAGLGAFNNIFDNWPGVAAIPYGNPNFYGSMIAMVDATGVALVIYASTQKTRVVGIITTVLGFMATFSCDSTSPLVGNVMVFLIVAFMEVLVRIRTKERKPFKMHVALWLLCVGLYILSAITINSLRSGSVINEIDRNIEYADEGFESDKMFSNRMVIWKYVWKALPDYWYLGTGPDNLILITDVDTAPDNVRTYDKAHNEYLNLAISEGVFAPIVYIVFLFTLFLPVVFRWKQQRASAVCMALFLAFFSYIAQAFFNISEIQVAPYFWIVCGLLTTQERSRTAVAEN